MIGRPFASDIVEQSAHVFGSSSTRRRLAATSALAQHYQILPRELPGRRAAAGLGNRDAGLRIQNSHWLAETVAHQNRVVNLKRKRPPRLFSMLTLESSRSSRVEHTM